MTNLAIATIGDNLPPTDAEIFRERMQEQHAKLFTRADELMAAIERMPTHIDMDDNDTAEKVTLYIKQLAGAIKDIESIRVSEKEPYLSMGRVVDGFFKSISDKLGKVKIQAQRPLDELLKAKTEIERKRRMEEADRLRKEAEARQAEAMALAEAQKAADADKVMNTAHIAEYMANKAEASANDRPAQLASIRTNDGGMVSLRTVWVGQILDRNALDLEALRQHLPADAMQKALNSFIAAGGRELRGARIFEESKAVVR